MNKITSVIFLVFALAGNVNSQTKTDFELWQLPSQINTIGNSYVFRTAVGKIAVMDGGLRKGGRGSVVVRSLPQRPGL